MIEALQAQGKRAFTCEEAQQILGLPRFNTLIVLSHLKNRKRVVTLTHSLYALWHPAERQWGLHPLPILDALMRFKQNPYYIALLSAADYHGAAHQKPQWLQVMIPRQLHLRNATKLGLSFHVKKNFPEQGLEQSTTPTGYVFYSCPELTALDILGYQSACGGFGNVCLVVRDLMSCLDPKRLKDVALAYPVVACIQRLGYLLEYFKSNSRLIKPLKRLLSKKELVPIALSPSYQKKGPLQKPWYISKNVNMETNQ